MISYIYIYISIALQRFFRHRAISWEGMHTLWVRALWRAPCPCICPDPKREGGTRVFFAPGREVAASCTAAAKSEAKKRPTV